MCQNLRHRVGQCCNCANPVAKQKPNTNTSSKQRRTSTVSVVHSTNRAKTPAEKARLTQFLEEREKLVSIAASVLRSARHDADIKQARMAELMARSERAISNMESGETEVTIADAILWARSLEMDPGEIFDRMLYFARQLYAKKQGPLSR